MDTYHRSEQADQISLFAKRKLLQIWTAHQIRLFHNNAVLIFQSKLLKKAYFIFKMTSQAKCTVDTMSEAKNVPTLVFKTIISCFWVNAAIGIFIVNFTHCFIPWNLVPTPWPIIWTFSKIVRNSKGVGLKANIE